MNKNKFSLSTLLTFALIFSIFTFSSPLYSQTSSNYDYSTVSNSFQFNKDLSTGSRGQDVSYLQCILGISPTGYFGPITKQNLTQFQDDHKEAVLTPVGLTSGTGFFGSSTRTYINTQISTDGLPNATCGQGINGTTNTGIAGGTNTGTSNSGTGSGSNGSSGSGSSGGSGSQSTPPPPNQNQTVACPVGYTCLPQQQSFNSNGGFNPQGGLNTGANNHVYPNTPQQQPGTGVATNAAQSGAGAAGSGGSGTTGMIQTGMGSGSGGQPGNFGGTVLYNSLDSINKDNPLRPCSASEPNIYLIVDDNKSSASTQNTKPLFLLVSTYETTLNQKPITSIGSSIPPTSSCVLGNFRPKFGNALNELCQDKTKDGVHVQVTVWPIDGLIQNFGYSNPDPITHSAGSCQAPGA